MNNSSNSSKIDASQSLDDRDAASKARVAAGELRRERRNKASELKEKYNQIRKTLNNTADRRELREEYKAALLDIDTSLESNESGPNSRIQDDGIDSIDSTNDPDDINRSDDIDLDGFEEKTLTICENGSPVDYIFLVKE